MLYYNMESIHINNWLNKMKHKYITIKDIEKLNKGDCIKLLAIDRNFYDLINNNEIGVEYPPEIFLQDNYIFEYTHNNKLNGKIRWVKEKKINNFNFDINYNIHNWYPLNDEGELPERDPQDLFSFKNVKKNYKEYPQETLIGWRGPMLLWKDVINNNIMIYR